MNSKNLLKKTFFTNCAFEFKSPFMPFQKKTTKKLEISAKSIFYLFFKHS